MGGTTINLGKIPTFATGGIVYRPTMGLFGESGAEAILPLTSKAAMSQLVNEIIASAGTVGGGVSGNSIDIERAVYNATYNAVSSAIGNSNLLNDILDEIEKGHTIELDGKPIYKNMIKRAMSDKKAGREGRLVLAEELY